MDAHSKAAADHLTPLLLAIRGPSVRSTAGRAAARSGGDGGGEGSGDNSSAGSGRVAIGDIVGRLSNDQLAQMGMEREIWDWQVSGSASCESVASDGLVGGDLLCTLKFLISSGADVDVRGRCSSEGGAGVLYPHHSIQGDATPSHPILPHPISSHILLSHTTPHHPISPHLAQPHPILVLSTQPHPI